MVRCLLRNCAVAHPTLFQVDLGSKARPFPHFWEHTVGSGHATLALRADWQRQMERCHSELGFRHVRFHGILSDDMGTFLHQDGKEIYSYFNSDQILDFLLSIGMKPFIELSFMPTALASGKKTVFHYRGNVTPPQDYAKWEKLIKKSVQHWADRYGVLEVKNWFFEVWNEPNLKAFWTGSKEDYFKFYEVSARAVKSVHAEFQVGGPATAKNAWIEEFLQRCKTKKLPLDFISTHHYPTDAFGNADDDTLEQLAASHRSVLRDDARKVKKQAGGKPVYYTEWSSSSNPFDELHDEPYASAFITKTVMEAQGLVEGYSYWTFSDLFEENYFSSRPFHGGFGLMNIHGIPKPAYRAYQILHQLGDQSLKVEGHHPTVDCWATLDGKRAALLLSNSALPTHPIRSERVEIQIENGFHLKSATVLRVDETHANSTEAWKKMGRPETLNPTEIEQLEKASLLKPETIEVVKRGQLSSITLVVPPQGIACISLDS